MLEKILLLILAILIVGTLPSWRYSSSWGYYPSAGLGVLFVVVLVLFVI